MIIEILIKLFSALMGSLSWILPDWRLPELVDTSVNVFYTHVLAWDWLFPFSTMMQIMVTLVLFHSGILFVRGAFGLLSLLRGGGKMDI